MNTHTIFPLGKHVHKINKTAQENVLTMALTDIPLKYGEPNKQG